MHLLFLKNIQTVVKRIKLTSYINKKISREQWLNDMLVYGFTPDVSVYIATDETDLDWFQPLHRAGFKLYFAANFTDLLSFPQLPPALRQDMNELSAS